MIQDYQIQEFLRQAHRVGDAGLTLCSSGNISWRIGDEALVSGTGSWVPTLPKEKVAVCRVSDGEVLNGVKPSMESGFHLGVLRERPDCDVVLHFQSKYATVVSCMTETPKDFNVTAEVPCHVGREIPVIPYFRPGSPELAEAVKAALKNHNSALMLKHGQVVCGKTFDEVFERAMFFEDFLRAIWIRPEDLPLYEPYVGVVKLATRRHPNPAKIVAAYATCSYDGGVLAEECRALLESFFRGARGR